MSLPKIDDHWNYNDPDSTAAAFRKLLAQHPEAPSAWRLELRTQLARTHSLTQRFDAAHAVLDDVEESLTASHGDSTRVRVRVLLERGRTYRSAGELDQARPLFEQALELAREGGEEGLTVDSAHMLALVEDGDRALAWNREALAMAESSEQEAARRWLGALYNNTGWALHDLGRLDEALEVFNRALSFRETQGQDKPILIARWCVGRCLRSLGRLEEALALQNALRDSYASIGEPSGYNAEELGELHLALGDGEQARVWFGQAWEILSKDTWLVKHEPERLARLASLGGRQG